MSKYTKEDLVPHETCAGAIQNKDRDGQIRWLILDHVKHDMLTFPIGKCKPDQTIEECLRSEIKEEVGIDVVKAKEAVAYTNVYDFDGTKVPIFTHVFEVEQWDGYPANLEPTKHRKLKMMTEEEIMSSGRKIAHCIMAYFNKRNMPK